MGILDDIKDFVSPYLNGIIEAFKAFMEKVKGVVKTIFTRIVDFKNQIVGWFKSLNLIKGIHIPFITHMVEVRRSQSVKKMKFWILSTCLLNLICGLLVQLTLILQFQN